MPSLKNISLVSLVNKQDIYQENVLESTKNEKDKIQYVWISWAKDASSALNYALNRCEHEIILCCHQDVEFLPGWWEKLEQSLNNIKQWGVLGMAGTTFSGQMVGTHSGLGMNGRDVYRVQTLDCSTIILKKSKRMRFDENLKYFHGYGEDIALQANWLGWGTFVIDVPMKHNTKWTSGPGMKESFEYLRKKWKQKFGTIYTTVGSY